MKVDKSKWEQNFISDCIKTVKVKGAIQKKDYQQYGKYPIISQEKDFISGYCDSIENLNSIGEVVIFGDHTRVLKFVDFDFCVGADGVKVIRPSLDISAKYLFYFLTWADIPNNGYSRHFKFLKELSISYPPIPIQQVIAEELDAVQGMIDGYMNQIADLDVLAQSIFLDTFGNVATNDKHWDLIPMGQLGDLKNGLNYSKGERGKSVKIIGVGDFQSIKSISSFDNICSIEVKNISQEYLLHNGDIVFVRSNGNKNLVGRCLDVYPNGIEVTFSGFCIRFRKSVEIIKNKYLIALLTEAGFKKAHILKSNGIGIQNINQKLLANIPIPVPPISLQQHFATQVEAIEKQKELLRQQLTDVETLMAERMQYYFS
ncbi:restriction endonuclease subunit S [uncultured Rikenella sp.]|uniref:restriction endonuclease subunit S n=1 Tax=uncultured Rikenella sp. TaxID=368003 RepID=UPI002611B649|nr:restriction endonuclease subunit S [uncultured Rikenella sp.]